MNDVRPPMTVCFGGGGAFAFGFNMGVAAGLLEEGIDLRNVPKIGTSAGSHAAAALGSGLAFEHVAELWASYVERQGRRIWVRASELTEEVYGAVGAVDVAGVAVRMLTFKRVLLSTNDHLRLADIVAASSSPIPLTRPHHIGRRRYIDGGWRRVASADLTPAAELQLLCTPFASREQGFLGRSGGRQARREIRQWKESTGGEVLQVGPTDDMIAIPVKGMSALGDMTIGRKIYDMAIPLGRDTAAKLRADFPHVAARL